MCLISRYNFVFAFFLFVLNGLSSFLTSNWTDQSNTLNAWKMTKNILHLFVKVGKYLKCDTDKQ